MQQCDSPVERYRRVARARRLEMDGPDVTACGSVIVILRLRTAPHAERQRNRQRCETCHGGCRQSGFDEVVATVRPPGSFGRSGLVNVMPAFERSPSTSSPCGFAPVFTHATRSSNALVISG